MKRSELKQMIREELLKEYDQETATKEFLINITTLMVRMKKINLMKAERYAEKYWRTALGWNKDEFPRILQMLSNIEKRG